ncbi:PREDICTED: heat shock transcription factor, X-linked-like [Chrysochloris asiatica]|uniref:Heat shock transcription factor, X-linked-like n=1 Tax=Chrysochloris asiatica TaxID=185453 RepID=A0A9B0TT39_CHRAS|nr:PREDICTED: heat shock transcription factor, X-linked-like [Chrysochloris asiatica]
MATEGAREKDRVKLVSVGDMPEEGAPLNAVPDPNVELREISGEHRDHQHVSQDPGFPDNAGPSSQDARVEESFLVRFPFPSKLWMLVESSEIKSVYWNECGDLVIIEEDLFQQEVLLRRGAERIFEIDSLKSIIRQFKVHGFVKIRCSNTQKKLMVYRNPNFKRGHPWLLQNIRRRGTAKKSAHAAFATRLEPDTMAPSPKRKKQTSGFQQKSVTKDPNKPAALGKPPNLPGPSNTQCFMPSSFGSVTNMTGAPLPRPAPVQPTMDPGEGTSQNTMPMSLPAGTWPAVTDPLVTRPRVYADYTTVLSMYNTCYSILMMALSVMAPDEAPRAPQCSAGHDCALCEQYKSDQED